MGLSPLPGPRCPSDPVWHWPGRSCLQTLKHSSHASGIRGVQEHGLQASLQAVSPPPPAPHSDLALCPLCQPLSPTASCSLGSGDCLLLLLVFLFEYGCFTMLCWFLQYNTVSQLYVRIYPLPLEASSHPHPAYPGHQRTELRFL